MRDDVSKKVKALIHGCEGVEIVEAAFVLPIVFMFLFGVIWFGLAFNLYSTANVAAREGARTAAHAATATLAPPAGGWKGTSFPGNQAVEDAVVSVLQGARADKTKIAPYVPLAMQSPPFCDPPFPTGDCTTTGNNITVCRFVRLNPGSSPQQCGALVSFQYPSGIRIPFPAYPLFRTRQVTISVQGESIIQN